MSDITRNDDGADWVIVRMGKGRKDRFVPLAPDVAQVGCEYITARKLKRDVSRLADQEQQSSFVIIVLIVRALTRH